MTKGEKITGKLFDGATEYIIGDRFINEQRSMMIHERDQVDMTGRLAIRLVEHFGVVAGKPGPEDSKGRSTLDLLSPDEVVDRAYDIAKSLVARLQYGGHIQQVPSMVDEPEIAPE